MEDSEFKKYVELIASMCIDFLMKKTTKETFIMNLEISLDNIKRK
jgi:hypothetical protein